MEHSDKTTITVEATVNAPVEKVWEQWTTPEHIMRWNNASPDWHTPKSENDLRPGGTFNSRMEARDGSIGFDFNGVYRQVVANELITYTLGDGREVKISFEGNGDETHILETFEAEETNPLDFQKAGWQAILDNFRKYVEG